jgi:hypothetical protein
VVSERTSFDPVSGIYSGIGPWLRVETSSHLIK